jgi:hypothetical protein
MVVCEAKLVVLLLSCDGVGRARVC